MVTYELVDGIPVVAGREVRFATYVRHDDLDPGLFVLRHRGFHVPLENSLILSTQWGNGNHCLNYMINWLGAEQPFLEACPTAELACWWDRDGRELLPWPDGDIVDGDIVTGYFPAENWWELVEVLSRMGQGACPCNEVDVVSLFDGINH